MKMFNVLKNRLPHSNFHGASYHTRKNIKASAFHPIWKEIRSTPIIFSRGGTTEKNTWRKRVYLPSYISYGPTRERDASPCSLNNRRFRDIERAFYNGAFPQFIFRSACPLTRKTTAMWLAPIFNLINKCLLPYIHVCIGCPWRLQVFSN